MALTRTAASDPTGIRFDPATGSRPVSERVAGLDVVRALALVGVVVMNYHGFLILRGADIDSSPLTRFFDPWTGPMATRFAATFVLVAGAGVSLMTASARPGGRSSTARSEHVADLRSALRWRLVRRGVVLYVVGQLVERLWPGTILVYYGALFVIAAFVFTLRDRWIVILGATAVVAAWAIRVWEVRRIEDGGSAAWLRTPDPGSWQDRVFEVAVNGTHPLLPWLGFFCAGIVLGRHLRDRRWTLGAFVVGVALFVGARIVTAMASTSFQERVLSDDPFDRGGIYVASALGTALVGLIGISWLVERPPLAGSAITDALGAAGQMSLTIYLLHVAVFRLLVVTLDVIEPAGLATSLGLAAAFWVGAVAFAVVWRRTVGRGPAEVAYRWLGG